MQSFDITRWVPLPLNVAFPVKGRFRTRSSHTFLLHAIRNPVVTDGVVTFTSDQEVPLGSHIYADYFFAEETYIVARHYPGLTWVKVFQEVVEAPPVVAGPEDPEFTNIDAMPLESGQVAEVRAALREHELRVAAMLAEARATSAPVVLEAAAPVPDGADG